MRADPPKLITVVWYRREDWTRLVELFGDRGGLPKTFEQWRRQTEDNEVADRAAGYDPRRVLITAEALADWCRTNGVPPTRSAALTFATEEFVRRRRSFERETAPREGLSQRRTCGQR